MKVRCSFCRKYVDRDSVVRRGIQAFCSNEHLYDYLNSSRKSQAIKQRKKSNDLSSEDKLEIIKLDNFRCRFCGTEYGLHVHHIKYRSEGGSNDPSNLITLCHHHHDTIHSNKKRYQSLCQTMIKIREEYSLSTFTLPYLENLILENSLEKFLDQERIQKN